MDKGSIAQLDGEIKTSPEKGGEMAEGEGHNPFKPELCRQRLAGRRGFL